MTIHSSHPFPTEPDPVRRFRGRLGGAVTLWTSGSPDDRAGLTVSSVLVAGGEPGRVLALLDPDSDLVETVRDTGRAVVHLLSWRHRELADAFAGVTPAPGGPWRLASWTDSDFGPRLADAAGWAEVRLEREETVGWSTLVVATIDHVELAELADDDEPLVHRRGRYLRSGP